MVIIRSGNLAYLERLTLLLAPGHSEVAPAGQVQHICGTFRSHGLTPPARVPLSSDGVTPIHTSRPTLGSEFWSFRDPFCEDVTFGADPPFDRGVSYGIEYTFAAALLASGPLFGIGCLSHVLGSNFEEFSAPSLLIA